ncbi:hypothetical protein EWM64_g7622 [Hericium alpestre]|uniref:Uncharacterized protein n=1 Tax=Hericium alpestre TaxID=135208 RepID=A0A4Y9ZQ68_9AGAM|nr:hypothetical protein EWM64_g7622 [Hericium alpestre]
MQMASPQQRQQELEQESYRQQEESFRRQEQEQESYRQQESYQQQDLYQQREQEPYQQRRQEQQQESYHIRQQDGYQFRQQEIRQFRRKEQHQYQQQEQYHQEEQEQERYVLQEQEPYQQQQESYQQHQRYAPPAVPPSQAIPPRALLSRPTSRYTPPTPPPVPYRPSINTANIAAPQPIPSGSTNVLKRKVSPPVSASTLVGFQPSFDSHRSFQWPALTSNIFAQIKGEDVGIRGIVFSATGNYIAVNCHDCTVRVWDNILHTEIARLSHVAPVVSAAWLEDDEGILSLSENGSLGKWTRTPQMPGDQWQWTKIAEPSNAERKPEDVPTAMAYIRDRIAVAFPRVGVKVWMLNKGTWQPQRSILRQNVTAIHFVEDGDALLGGTKDGVLWYCQIPNGTLRAYTFFKSTVYHIDVNHSGSHALVAQTGGRTHIVGIRQDDNKGKIEQVYALKDSDSHPNATYDFGALFTSKDSLIMFGTVDGCVLLWDKDKAVISCGLDLGEGAVAQAVGSFTSRSSSSENCLVTGSKDGKLTWWPQPSISDIEEFSHKRMKTGAS